MANDPLRHPGQTLVNIGIGLVGLVIVINLISAAVEPYMRWIGLVIAGVLIILAIAGAVVGIIAAVQWVKEHRNSGGKFNGT